MFQIVVFQSTEPEAVDLIEAELSEFNRQANSLFWAARELPENAPRPLSVVARDQSGKVVGGLIGETQFKWLKISLMMVEPAFQRQGVGHAMMTAAEAEAIRRACQYSYVDTMDYQAPGFYERIGYRLAGRLDDWDSHGHSKLFYAKCLKADQ